MVNKKCQLLRNGLFIVTCDLYIMKLAWEIHFSNNTGMSYINCICMLVIIFICTIALLLLTMYVAHVNANIF